MSEKLITRENERLDKEQRIIMNILRLLAEEGSITRAEEIKGEELIRKGAKC